jgi:Metallo-peptidase family M12B Reprolysin-like
VTDDGKTDCDSRGEAFPDGGYHLHLYRTQTLKLNCKFNAWDISGILNHEVGHMLGLGHSYQTDGCGDTDEVKENNNGDK